MKLKNEKSLIITILAITLCLSAIILSIGYILTPTPLENDSWRLKSYGDNLALYNGESVIEIFDAVLLSDLPEKDKILLTEGITFATKEEALIAAEDYDG